MQGTPETMPIPCPILTFAHVYAELVERASTISSSAIDAEHQDRSQRGSSAFKLIAMQMNQNGFTVLAIDDHRCVFRVNSRLVVKVYPATSTGLAISFVREVAALRRLRGSRFCLQYTQVQATNRCALLHTPAYKFDLRECISAKGKLSVDESRSILFNVFSALQVAQACGLHHRDVKPQNVFLNDAPESAVLGDWGLSYFNPPCTPILKETSVATLYYRAPELLLGAQHYTVSADLWSCGAMLYEMLTGRVLTEERSVITQILAIFQEFGTPNTRTWPKVHQLQHFRGKIFPQFPGTRAKLANVGVMCGALDRPEVEALLSDLLQLDPEKRIKLDQALRHKFFSPLTSCSPLTKSTPNVRSPSIRKTLVGTFPAKQTQASWIVSNVLTRSSTRSASDSSMLLQASGSTGVPSISAAPFTWSFGPPPASGPSALLASNRATGSSAGVEAKAISDGRLDVRWCNLAQPTMSPRPEGVVPGSEFYPAPESAGVGAKRCAIESFSLVDTLHLTPDALQQVPDRFPAKSSSLSVSLVSCLTDADCQAQRPSALKRKTPELSAVWHGLQPIVNGLKSHKMPQSKQAGWPQQTRAGYGLTCPIPRPPTKTRPRARSASSVSTDGAHITAQRDSGKPRETFFRSSSPIQMGQASSQMRTANACDMSSEQILTAQVGTDITDIRTWMQLDRPKSVRVLSPTENLTRYAILLWFMGEQLTYRVIFACMALLDRLLDTVCLRILESDVLANTILLLVVKLLGLESGRVIDDEILNAEMALARALDYDFCKFTLLDVMTNTLTAFPEANATRMFSRLLYTLQDWRFTGYGGQEVVSWVLHGKHAELTRQVREFEDETRKKSSGRERLRFFFNLRELRFNAP